MDRVRAAVSLLKRDIVARPDNVRHRPHRRGVRYETKCRPETSSPDADPQVYTVVNHSSSVSRDMDFPKKTCANCSVVSLTGRAFDAGLRPVDSVSGQTRDHVMTWCSPRQYAVARQPRRTLFPRRSVSRFQHRPATSVPPQNPHGRVACRPVFPASPAPGHPAHRGEGYRPAPDLKSSFISPLQDLFNRQERIVSLTKNYSGCGQHSYWSVRISICCIRRRNKMVSNLLQKSIVINSRRTVYRSQAGHRPPSVRGGTQRGLGQKPEKCIRLAAPV